MSGPFQVRHGSPRCVQPGFVVRFCLSHSRGQHAGIPCSHVCQRCIFASACCARLRRPAPPCLALVEVGIMATATPDNLRSDRCSSSGGHTWQAERCGAGKTNEGADSAPSRETGPRDEQRRRCCRYRRLSAFMQRTSRREPRRFEIGPRGRGHIGRCVTLFGTSLDSVVFLGMSPMGTPTLQAPATARDASLVTTGGT